MSNVPEKNHGEDISLAELFDMFPDNDTARKWFEDQIWPDGPRCPDCRTRNVQCNISHPRMTHRCRECEGNPMFSVRKGTVMEDSRIPLRKWAIAVYLVSTSIKRVSSMKLHRDLKITQKSAWYMLHRIRKSFETDTPVFGGPVEVDETFIGGKRKNRSNSRRKALNDTGRDAVGKTAVAGMKDRETNEGRASVVDNTNADTLQDFVKPNADEKAMVHTDGITAYDGLPFDHESVNHSVSEYVKVMTHEWNQH